MKRGRKAVKAWRERGRINVKLSTGRTVGFSVALNPRLARGTAAQLNNIEISPYGLHWPDLDEDLSIAGIIAGRVRGHGDKNSGTTTLARYLKFGVWNLFGVWCLVFGVLTEGHRCFTTPSPFTLSNVF